MDGYLQKPSEMDDATLTKWVVSFRESPPTGDLFVERAWARQLEAEASKRFGFAQNCTLHRGR